MANQSGKTKLPCRKSDLCWVPCRNGRISEEAVHGWVQLDGSACRPTNALLGGHLSDGTLIHVGRAHHDGAVVPARAMLDEMCAYLGNYHTQQKRPEFEVLTGNNYKWVPASQGSVPPNAVIGGYGKNTETYYLGRGTYDGSLVVGKVHPSARRFLFAYKENEYHLDSYEALVYSTPYEDWVQLDVSAGHPPNPVVGGHLSDGTVIYVGRGHHDAAFIPGRVTFNENCAYIGNNGGEHRLTDYEVLTGENYKWLPGSNGSVPPNAVIGGYGKDGETTYIGRGNFERSLVVGKVRPSSRRLFFAYNGREKDLENYEVLVHLTPSEDGEQITDCGLTWISEKSSPRGGIAIDCVTRYVGRAWHNGNLIPALVDPESSRAYVCHDGRVIKTSKYEVLIDTGFGWKSDENGHVPPDAVEAGRTSRDEKLFIGRAHHLGCFLVGKIQKSHGCMYAAIGEQQVAFKKYEVLVCEPQLSPRMLFHV